MIRTQIYLTEEEHEGIGEVARTLKRKQSEVVRQAIDEFLTRAKPEGKLAKVRKARGIWKDQKEVSLEQMRAEFDRY